MTNHDYYVSVCDIRHNGSNQTLEIALKIFINDFEVAIKEETNVSIFLSTNKENPNADKYISKYIAKHFHLKTNKKENTLFFIGKEFQNDAVWCYIEAHKVKKINTLDIQNDLLTAQFSRQINIVNAEYNNETKGILLTKSETEGSISFVP